MLMRFDITLLTHSPFISYAANFPPLGFQLLILRIEISLPKCLSFRDRSWRGRFRASAKIVESSFHSLQDYSGFVGRQRLFLNVEASIIEFVGFFKLLQVSVWNVGRILYKLRYYSLRRAPIFWGFKDCGARSRSGFVLLRFVVSQATRSRFCLSVLSCAKLDFVFQPRPAYIARK